MKVHNLDETLMRRSCMDVMVTVTPSPDLIDHVSPDPLDIFHAFPSCSLSSHLPECCDLSPIDSYVLLERNEVDF